MLEFCGCGDVRRVSGGELTVAEEQMGIGVVEIGRLSRKAPAKGREIATRKR